MSEQLQSEIRALVGAISSQTQAINALSESNRMLVEMMADMDGETDEEQDAGVYLDGSTA